ncbi:hypothetical protein EI94DRAFT_808774 [Lactarius quietus]|nr:hypothetical protein EI94DRAFT_808774 [Lactarius quietus]
MLSAMSNCASAKPHHRALSSDKSSTPGLRYLSRAMGIMGAAHRQCRIGSRSSQMARAPQAAQKHELATAPPHSISHSNLYIVSVVMAEVGTLSLQGHRPSLIWETDLPGASERSLPLSPTMGQSARPSLGGAWCSNIRWAPLPQPRLCAPLKTTMAAAATVSYGKHSKM